MGRRPQQRHGILCHAGGPAKITKQIDVLSHQQLQAQRRETGWSRPLEVLLRGNDIRSEI